MTPPPSKSPVRQKPPENHPKKYPWHAEVLTLFPDMFPGPLIHALAGKALAKGIWSLHTTDIREFGIGGHRKTDDTPFGGGAGMVMRPDVLAAALAHAKNQLPTPPNQNPDTHFPCIYLSPRGTPLTQSLLQTLATKPGVILIAGRYEGIDQRIIDHENLWEVSIGDYVLSGGEMAALVLIDGVVRLLPEVLGNAESNTHESFADNLLEHPHYTQPRDWQGLPVPAVLLSGDHGKIAEWRRQQAHALTKTRRPDLWQKQNRPPKKSPKPNNKS